MSATPVLLLCLLCPVSSLHQIACSSYTGQLAPARHIGLQPKTDLILHALRRSLNKRRCSILQRAQSLWTAVVLRTRPLRFPHWNISMPFWRSRDLQVTVKNTYIGMGKKPCSDCHRTKSSENCLQTVSKECYIFVDSLGCKVRSQIAVCKTSSL